MRSGPMSERVVFQVKLETTNAQGQIVTTWPTAFTVWAEVRQATQTRAQFFIRYRPGIGPETHRMIWDDRGWTIQNAVRDRKKSMWVIDSDFSDQIEVTHMQSTEREYLDGLPIVRRPQ